jgi:hypothetical protein
MKSIKLLTAMMFVSLLTHATVRTVNNAGGAQFGDLASAITAASSGDTIYVCGSASAYVGTNTNKTNLVFIGAGYNPQKQNPLKSTITNAWSIGNGNSVIGFDLVGNIAFPTNSVSNVKISRCRVTGFNSTNNTFTNCMFDNCIWANLTISSPFISQIFNGMVLSNCLFYAPSSYAQNIFNGNTLTGSGATVDHCAFIKDGTPINFFGGTPNATGFVFTNNIFINVTPATTGTSYQYTSNYSSVALSPTYGTGNLTGTIWPFVTPQASVTGTFQYAWDFHLAVGSPLVGAGTFGSEMGLYGGNVPFNGSGEAPIPQIDILMLNGTQFTPGGPMGIQFQSTIGN